MGKRVSERAFIRRKTDQDGLSVAPSPASAIYYFNKAYGVASLECDHIRQLQNPDGTSLDVEWDSPEHGNILHVPFYDPEIPDVALEALLTDLANRSCLVSEAEFAKAQNENDHRRKQNK